METQAHIDEAQPAQDAVILPVSYAQQRLWFLDRLDPDSAAYNVPVASRLRGELDVEALADALTALAARHESLRTTFTVHNGLPQQLVAGRPDVSLTITDLSGRPDAELAARTLADEDSGGKFDLVTGPLWRARLIRLADQDHILSLTLHHAIADAWSVGIFLRELSLLYAGFLDGQAPDLPELAIQYGDYAAWQREWMDSGGLDEQLAYWKAHLAGAPALLELPLDHPRPAMQSSAGAKVGRILPAPLVSELNALCEREGTTPFMALLTTFVTLMFRYTASEDIVVATPVANRNRLELEGLIGVFANTLAVRTQLDGQLRFRELLARVRETALGAYSNQDLPFEKLVEELNPPRDLSHAPVAQVMFVLHNHIARQVEFPGLQREVITTERGTSKFDLALFTEIRADGLRTSIEYCTDLFDEATIERMLDHFEGLLGAVVRDPATPLSELAMLTAAEVAQLQAWNATSAPYRDACLHELFAEHAQRRPDAVAVQCGDDQLTYAELDRRANQLAHELRRRDAGPGTLVGICVERSLELVVALLGVLKSGATYVPIDPGYPPERQAFMLADAQAPILLTQADLVDGLPEHDAALLCLDRDWDEVARNSPLAPDVASDPERLAYVIYTSGSTGRPKGVEIRHRSVVNLITHMRERFGVGDDDVMANLTTPAFDLSVPDWYLPLCSGCALVIVAREETMDAGALAARLARCGATVVQATPTTWQMLVDSGWEGAPGMRIVGGGEALPRELANQLVVRGAALWHMYGPTETTVWSAIRQLSVGEGPTPIGGPIANTSFFVMDRYGRRVPVGVAGELYIGGHGVARGYRNRPELTAEKFVSDPTVGDGGEPVYRTGDLVRWREGGTLEFLGRIDHQVKLRGFRIELGEIESVLREQAGVREALVVARADATGNRRLVAYLTGDSVEAGQLRTQMQHTLPDYMLPAAFVHLDAFPLTPNGKIDRAALPAPDDSARATSDYAAPATELERSLAEIWQRLLSLERVGVDDNFFELGGHSLLAVQVVHAVESELERTCTLAMLFRNPTIRSLAAELYLGGRENQSRVVLALSKGDGRPLFCICGVHAYQELADLLAPEIPAYGIFLPVEQELFARGQGESAAITISEMAAGYVEAVRAEQAEGPYMLLGFCFGGILAYEVARQLREAGQEVSALVMLDAKLRSSVKSRRGRMMLRTAKRWAVQQAAPVKAQVRMRLGGTAPDDDLGELERLEMIRLQAYRQAMREYQVLPYDGEAVLVRPSSTRSKNLVDPTYGWGDRVASLHIVDVPGDHINHLKRPNVEVLASSLRGFLDRARNGTPSK